MTTTTHINDPGGQATVPQVLAWLCLFMAEHRLPHPKRLELDEPRRRIEIRLPARKDLTVWLNAFGYKASDATSMPTANGGSWMWMRIQRYGWELEIEHRDVRTERTKLDADTVAALEEIAAPAEPAPIVSDETIAEAELAPEKLAMHIQAVSA